MVVVAAVAKRRCSFQAGMAVAAMVLATAAAELVAAVAAAARAACILDIRCSDG